MSKLAKFLAVAGLIAGTFAMTPGPALAQHHHHRGGGTLGGNWHRGGGGHWRGGGWGGGWSGGWGPGPFWGWGFGLPYYEEPYYVEPDCGWVRVRVRRHHHWVLRRVWRCW
jgi:uncharacterized membrane protein